MLALVLLCFLVQVFSNVIPTSNSPYYTIYKNGSAYSVENVQDNSGIVTAKFEPNLTTSGWTYITLKSSSKFSDYEQLYAAGYLEGALSTDIIYAYYQNVFVSQNQSTFPDSVVTWMAQNNAFMLNQIKANPDDPYWTHVSLVLAQIQGLTDGYNAYATNKLTYNQFMTINLAGDLDDLLAALGVDGVNWSNQDEVAARYVYGSHCSVLIKVADDFSELYAGHTTWFNYFGMSRVFRTLDLALSVAHGSSIMQYSSYPATVASMDDYYLLDSGLIVLETTNGIMNNSLYSAVVPDSLYAFVRVVIANRIASNGQEWVDVFSKYNSGTYNNQWIVVDTNKLVAGSDLEPGALFVLEQIPGYIESADVTNILTYGYWPSFNVPYFPYIYEVSGFAPYAAKYGSFFSYDNNPRAEIFRRDSEKVTSITALQQMMRYNDYTVDPISQGCPGYAISSRFDLVTGNVTNPFLTAQAFGGIDSKVTSAMLAKNMTSYIQSGPTHDSVPPFSFNSPEWQSVAHVGLPDVWNFSWVQINYVPL